MYVVFFVNPSCVPFLCCQMRACKLLVTPIYRVPFRRLARMKTAGSFMDGLTVMESFVDRTPPFPSCPKRGLTSSAQGWIPAFAGMTKKILSILAYVAGDNIHTIDSHIIMTKGKKSTKTADAFVQAVEQALEKISEPEALGRHSPLAAPYFMGNLLGNGAAHEISPAQRGQALAGSLRAAAQTLGEETQRVLNVSFFERKPMLNNTGVARVLGMSEATYYRHRAAAIDALAHAFNQRTVPPLRAETPKLRRMVGREGLVDACLSALHTGESVSLNGLSGIGKTATGAVIAQHWGHDRAFWFTVLPGLNDTLSSIAFAFSHFLRGLGASNAWRQLAADHGAINAERILGLIRHDLSELQGRRVLVCIDESDHLKPELHAHAQIIRFVESLGKMTPALFISQQPLFDADQPFILAGLSQNEMRAWLAQEQLHLSDSQCDALHAATRGRPLLIKLFMALLRDGEPADDVLRVLAGERSAEALFARMWKKLSDDERAILMAMAVFQTPAPADAWGEQQGVLSRLISMELAQRDDQGGVMAAPHMRELILNRIPPEALSTLHLRAASIREARGEFTSAARHYLLAGVPAMATWLWFAHRDTEMDKGHGPAALALFRSVKQSDLPHPSDRRTLALIRAQLAERAGEADEAERDLASQSWPANDALTPLARELMGDALQLQGRIEQAVAQYRAGQSALGATQMRQMTRLRVKSSYVYALRLRELGLARDEALIALNLAHNYCGLVEEEAGDYTAALQHYEAALQASAGMRNGDSSRADTLSHLGHLHMRMGNAAKSIECLQQAMAHAQKLGTPVQGLYDALNLSSAYIVAGQHEAAKELALQSLGMAEAMQHAFLVAGLAAGAAEACLNLGDLDQAEHLAMQSLREEEDVHRPYALTVLGHIALKRNQSQPAARWLQEAISNARQTSDRYAEAFAWIALADAHAALQQHDEEHKALKEALALCEQLGLAEAQAISSRLDEPAGT
jgi:tetratricopeptide (TPR) repeat protein